MELLKPIRIAVAALLFGWLTTPFSAAPLPPADAQREYAVKSVFLYNFCRFIEWPNEAFRGPNEPMVIGIIGEDPFGRLLEEAIEGETLRGRPIRIEHYRRAGEIACHVLFVSRSETAHIPDILAAVAGRSVVTVGESDLFLDRGGMIALTTDQNRVWLRINPTPLRAARVTQQFGRAVK